MNKKYWLKVGIGFGVVGLILSVYMTFGLAKFSCGFSGGCAGDFSRLVTFLSWDNFQLSLVIILIPAILIGIFIGWLYGKVKNLKKM